MQYVNFPPSFNSQPAIIRSYRSSPSLGLFDQKSFDCPPVTYLDSNAYLFCAKESLNGFKEMMDSRGSMASISLVRFQNTIEASGTAKSTIAGSYVL